MLVIGDIHGRYNELVKFLDSIPEEHKKDGICFVGDLIDRGEDAAKVVEFVKSNGYHCVRGNHEQMFIDYKGKIGRHYGSYALRQNGGMDTLRSYDREELVTPGITEAHLAWMKTLPIILQFPIKNEKGQELVVSHSNYDRESLYHLECGHTEEFEENVMWNRKHNPKDIDGIYNIYGHTAMKEIRLKENRADVDTGSGYPGGKISALKFPEMIQYSEV